MKARKAFEGGSGPAEDEDAIEPFETLTEVSMRDAMILCFGEISVAHKFLFMGTIDADI